MRFHAEPEAHQFPSMQLHTSDDRQLVVAKPKQESDLVWRHASGSQSRQVFAPALQHQSTGLDAGHLGTKRTPSEQGARATASYRRMVLVGIDETADGAAGEATVACS